MYANIKNNMAEIIMEIILYGKIVLTCFISGTSAMVDERIAVSPSGDALSPKDPPARTAPIAKGRLISAVIAKGTAIGISNAHVPHADPIKYDAAHPIKNLTTGIKIIWTPGPILLVIKFTNPNSSIILDNPQLRTRTIIGGIISFPPDKK